MYVCVCIYIYIYTCVRPLVWDQTKVLTHVNQVLYTKLHLHPDTHILYFYYLSHTHTVHFEQAHPYTLNHV
jgi:hypothetical protein